MCGDRKRKERDSGMFSFFITFFLFLLLFVVALLVLPSFFSSDFLLFLSSCLCFFFLFFSHPTAPDHNHPTAFVHFLRFSPFAFM